MEEQAPGATDVHPGLPLEETQEKYPTIQPKRRLSRRSSILSDASVNAFNTVVEQSEKIQDANFWFEMQDDNIVTVGFILIAIFVAAFCGIAAYLLHVAVYWSGCLGGANGCHQHILLDRLEDIGVNKSVFFLVGAPVSGLICSLILQLPVAKKCKGGGSAGAKVVISAGQFVSGWVPLLRIVLAAVYLGGGNTLGSEGPIIHLSSCLATWFVHILGFESRKMFSMFAVVGAAAGIAAGFGVVVTGVVFVIEELTRSLSPRSALIVSLGTGIATLVRHRLAEFAHDYIGMERHSMVPPSSTWAELTDADIAMLLLLCFPIGIINGLAGWTFTRCAWNFKLSLPRTGMPEWLFLPVVGFFSACIGVLVYEVTHVNGVWGTTMDVVPLTIEEAVTWDKVLLLFLGKFCCFTLQSAAGGPGGTLVPSLTAGGLVGILVGRIASCSEHNVAACAILGMGSLFAGVMHMPLTGVVIIYELTGATDLVVHVIFANFIASNVMARLPHGTHSFVHLALEHDPVWVQLGGQDFIETDAQEKKTLDTVGIRKILRFKTAAIRHWLMPDAVLLHMAFDAWKEQSSATSHEARQKLHALESQRSKYLSIMMGESDETTLRMVWGALIRNHMAELKSNACRTLKGVSTFQKAQVKLIGRRVVRGQVVGRSLSKVTPESEQEEMAEFEAHSLTLKPPESSTFYGKPPPPAQAPMMLPGTLEF